MADIEILFSSNEGAPVTVTYKGEKYEGTIAKVQFDDGHVRVNVPGYGLNKFKAEDCSRSW